MPEIRRKDVDSLAKKLESFAQELPEQEQNVLGWLLARAQATSPTELTDAELDSVAGGQNGPLSSQLADSMGLGPGTDDSVSVTWSKSIQ
jgi:uncharacterized protein YgiM (DUF1202 family)